ncbi:MAG: hypothetical protein HYY01_05495 [Chloroflexi bacterium]|nr:hypothetical protein [Chloroflexota bacterium]
MKQCVGARGLCAHGFTASYGESGREQHTPLWILALNLVLLVLGLLLLLAALGGAGWFMGIVGGALAARSVYVLVKR